MTVTVTRSPSNDTHAADPRGETMTTTVSPYEQITDALQQARDLTSRLRIVEEVTTSYVTVGVDADDGKPYITIDVAEGIGSYVAAHFAAQRLGLAEFSPGDYMTTWTGDVAGTEVTIGVEYDRTADRPAARLRRYLAHPAASAVLLTASAVAGSALTLAASRIARVTR